MDNTVINVRNKEFDITIKSTLDMPHLQVMEAAIVHLIEEFDTHFEEKSIGSEAPEHFYASLLSAIARHYAVDAYPDGDYENIDTVLEQLITDLRANGRL